MASQLATPVSKLASAPPVAPTPPGSWRHPRLDEISRRQQDSTFDEAKMYRVFTSLALLFLTFFIPYEWNPLL
jgi:nucleoporin POM34